MSAAALIPVSIAGPMLIRHLRAQDLFRFFFHWCQWICPLCSLICGPSAGITDAVQLLKGSLAKINGFSKQHWTFNLDFVSTVL